MNELRRFLGFCAGFAAIFVVAFASAGAYLFIKEGPLEEAPDLVQMLALFIVVLLTVVGWQFLAVVFTYATEKFVDAFIWVVGRGR